VKKMIFPYVKFLVSPARKKPARYIYRPVIPVRLCLADKVIPFDALVDSGADENTFPGWIIKALGHDIYRGKEKIFSGIGGSVLSYLHPTRLKVGDVSWIEDVYYSHEWDDMPFGLLGEAGFFSHFDVHFHYQEKEIILLKK